MCRQGLHAGIHASCSFWGLSWGKASYTWCRYRSLCIDHSLLMLKTWMLPQELMASDLSKALADPRQQEQLRWSNRCEPTSSAHPPALCPSLRHSASSHTATITVCAACSAAALHVAIRMCFVHILTVRPSGHCTPTKVTKVKVTSTGRCAGATR